MNTFTVMLTNWWTTIVGVAAGVAQYLAVAGATPPTTKAEWMSFVSGLLIAALGVVAKSATTGSEPK
jgi:hypothetical protein